MRPERMAADHVLNFLALHLAALTSLKGEIIDLTNRIQHISTERDIIEKQLSKSQSEKLRIQREYEDRLDQTITRYEERIIELHSVIAELRKKIERHQINVIREEDEYEESEPGHSNKSDGGGSVNENAVNESASIDVGNDINTEFSRVVSELECAIENSQQLQSQVPNLRSTENGSQTDEEKAIQVCREIKDLQLEEDDTCPDLPPKRKDRPPTFRPPPPPPPNQYPDPEYMQEEIDSLRVENYTVQEQLGRQDEELNEMKILVGSLTEEKEVLIRRLKDLQTKHGKESSCSPANSRTSTPTKSQMVSSSSERHGSSGEPFAVAKVAELKKLKTFASECQVHGSDISNICSSHMGVESLKKYDIMKIRYQACKTYEKLHNFLDLYGKDMLKLPNAKVTEHLVQSLHDCSNMQEMVQALYKCGTEISEVKVKEFEVETERLTSKVDHLKSQQDVLMLTLDESKAQCDRLSVLIGKYESNNTALQLAVSYSDQAMEAYEVLCALLESELGVILANCRATGLGSIGGDAGSAEEHGDVAAILQRSHHNRKKAENVAKHLLQKLDRSCGVYTQSISPNPWEDVSSASRTTSTTSSTGSSADIDFSKLDEQRLRDYIQQLKNDRASVKMTVLELESVHIDPFSNEPKRSPEAQRLDLENAVLMQELMAMKEEKAELKAQNYLLEKEKKALELSLSGKDSQKQAFLVHIKHLKSEVKEQQIKLSKEGRSKKEDFETTIAGLADQLPSDSLSIAQDLSDALKREKKLKLRIQELVTTLEKLSQNSEVRHQQSVEFVNDLKKANSALISAFDKAKKKYQSKLKKLETQTQAITERYETQIQMLKQRVLLLEEAARAPTSETSL